MKRRDVIKNVALMMGGVFSAPTLKAMKLWEQNTPLPNSDFSLSDNQRQILAEVSEIIIPKSETPGAKDVGVPAFVEMMLKDCYKQDSQTIFTNGLNALNQDSFLSMDIATKVERLKKIEAEAKGVRGTTFWRLMKELTLLGYFTSEKGLKSSFNYVQIPGKFEPIKLKPNQKAFAY